MTHIDKRKSSKLAVQKTCARGISSHRNIAHLLPYTLQCVQELRDSMKNGHLQSPGLGLGAGFDEGECCWGIEIDSLQLPTFGCCSCDTGADEQAAPQAR